MKYLYAKHSILFNQLTEYLVSIVWLVSPADQPNHHTFTIYTQEYDILSIDDNNNWSCNDSVLVSGGLLVLILSTQYEYTLKSQGQFGSWYCIQP